MEDLRPKLEAFYKKPVEVANKASYCDVINFKNFTTNVTIWEFVFKLLLGQKNYQGME